MFYTHVIAAHGGLVDAGRAQFLMDNDLRQQAEKWVSDNWPVLEERGASGKDQAFWDYYCARHYDKYGEYFRPTVDPDWR